MWHIHPVATNLVEPSFLCKSPQFRLGRNRATFQACVADDPLCHLVIQARSQELLDAADHSSKTENIELVFHKISGCAESYASWFPYTSMPSRIPCRRNSSPDPQISSCTCAQVILFFD